MMIGGINVAVNAEFDVLTLSPVLWLDAADAATITHASNSVSQWDDKSGNDNHFAQASGGKQPTTGTRTINGQNGIDFNGSSDGLGLTVGSLPASASVYIVYQADADTAYMTVTSTGTGKFPFLAQSGLSQSANSGSGTPSYYKNSVQQTVTTRAEAYTAFSSANALLQTLLNVNMSTWSGLSVADYGGFIYLDGAVAEIVVTDGTESAGERAALESYLMDRWGVT